MATTNEPLQLNLGSLRSAMSLTLHTHHASRIWHGRAAAEGRPGIVGLNGYIAQMNKMRRGSEQDDPYSDFWMLRIEDKLEPNEGHAAIAARTGGPGAGERAAGTHLGRKPQCSARQTAAVRQCAARLCRRVSAGRLERVAAS